MFANFTSETCTGTGLTLTLAGATTGQIPFAASYADGAPVAYVVEDSGGVIKVAGIGTYNATPNTITRNDTWNWNGTVVDKNPATNITLSGGTHTVRCDIIGSNIPVVKNTFFTGLNAQYHYIKRDGDFGSDGGNTRTLDTTKIDHVVFVVPENTTIDAVEFKVTTAIASSLTRVGLSSIGADGNVDALLAQSVNIDTSTTGIKEGTFTGIYFPNETQVFAWISSDSAIAINGKHRFNIAANPTNPVDGTGFRTYLNNLMPVSSGQPAYPAPVNFAANPYYIHPDLLLRRA